MHQLTDEALVARYLEAGDQQAFRVLVERHQERIFGYLMGMVRDREAANDLFQDTFIRALGAMRREEAGYVQQGRWLAWIMRIARNAALDHLRRQKRWTSVRPDADEDGLSFWDRLPDEEPPLDDHCHLMREWERVEACIDRLSPEQREVVLLRHEADLTFREIAELTDVSINTALGRMRYALLNLRRMMQAPAEAQAPRVSA